MNISVYPRMYEIVFIPSYSLFLSMTISYPIGYLTLYGLTECIINQIKSNQYKDLWCTVRSAK